MSILRLTTSLSVSCLAVAIAPFWLAGNASSQPLQRDLPLLVSQVSSGTSSGVDQTTAQTTNQTTNGQSAVSQPYATPGSTLQTPGASLTTPGATQVAPSTTLQTPGTGLTTPGATQSTTGQSTTGQATGSGQSSSGTTGSSATGSTDATQSNTTQSINGQPVQLSPTTGTTQSSGNGQAIGPSLPASTKTPGAEQTFVNGQSTGTTQIAPPITGTNQIPNGQATGNQSVPGLNGQASPNSVLYPPQIIQGSGTIAPTTQTPNGTAATGTPTTPNQAVPNQAAPSPSATRTAAPGTTQALPTQLQPGQGSLDVALQQATCAQNWRQAIRLVNTAIAATPASQTGYRSQLASYRNHLQTLQAKGVRAPNWAQQCQGGAVANPSNQ